MTPSTQEIFARCAGCGLRWKVCTLPMTLTEFARILEQTEACPGCGGEALMDKNQGTQVFDLQLRSGPGLETEA